MHLKSQKCNIKCTINSENVLKILKRALESQILQYKMHYKLRNIHLKINI